MTRRRSLAARAALGLAALVLALAAAEIAVRLAGAEPRLFNPTGYDWKEAIVPAEDLPYLFKPGSSFSQQWPSDPRGHFDPGARLVYQLNRQGFRGRDFTRERTGAFRIAILGDSFAFGAGVRVENTAAAVIERELTSNAPWTAEVYNFALPGYNTGHEVTLFEKAVLDYRPDAAVIWYFLNDADTETDLRIMRKISGGERLKSLRRWSRLLDLIAAPVDERIGENELIAGYRQAYDPQGKTMAGLDAQFERFARLCRDHDIVPILAIHPILYRLGPDHPFRAAHQEVRVLAEKNGIFVIDLLPCLEGHDADSLHVHPRDLHPNQLAHRLAAQCCLPALRQVLDKMRREASPD